MAVWSPMVEQWRPYLVRLAGDLPLDFLMKWLTMESGGNPCSTGIPGVEAGIWQTYHPQDDRYGATFDELRAACQGFTQQQSRDLTDDEKEKQMAGLGLVRQSVKDATAQLAAVGAIWPQSSSDFWKLVKLQHGLPIVPIDLLPKITAKNGKPPASWDEFKAEALAFPPEQMTPALWRFRVSPSTQGLSSRMEDTLQNAEDAGQYGGGFIGGTVSATSVAKLVLLGLGAWGLYQMFGGYTRNPARRRRRLKGKR